MKNWLFIIWMVFLIVQLPSLAMADDPPRDPFYTMGNSINAPDANAVSERIDPFSGILTLVHTDLHLPGNGGLDLNLVRTYNSMIWGRRDTSFPGLVAENERSPLGIGWAMHMGIMRNPLGQGSSTQTNQDNPVFEMPDGSRHVFYKDKNDTSRFISKEFGLYKRISGGSGYGTWELSLNDGTVYTMEYGTANAGYNLVNDYGTILEKVAQVTNIRNAANTASIDVNYYKHANGYSYLSSITDSVGRNITFNYDYTLHRLTSITTDTRTLGYGYTTINGNNYLNSVTHPVSVSPKVDYVWNYGYETAGSTYELNSLTYPTGGRIDYTYDDKSFATGITTVKFRVAVGKKTFKRGGVLDGTWSYAYSAPSSGDNVTTITAPGVTETHKFYGWGNTNNVWKVGLPISSVYSGAFSQSITYSWSQGSLISYDQIGNAGWVFPGGQIWDDNIYVPNLSSKTIVRDGKEYVTTYSEFNAYGDPQSISESGESGGTTRNRTLTYLDDPTAIANNIVKGKPTSETVTGTFPGSSTTTWTYDTSSGNVTEITKDGVKTTYVYDTAHGNHGNLYSVKDANNHTITYEWTNGRISKETNDYYSISRTINSNGTVKDETNGRGTGYKTTFLYDGLLRPTSKAPPAGNPTSITYPNTDGSIRRETRGGYVTDYTFDGFGRPSGSSDSKGITTTIAYTPYGTKDYEDTNIGDKISYDYFGRVEEILHKDTTKISYVYGTASANETTITDEKLKNTKLTYKAFGNPDEKYLMSVYDAALKTTTYSRNIQGNLTGITQGSITRSFGYDTVKKNFLTSETNPETGTITYGRDSVGNMTSKSDPSSLTYVYDNINRLTRIYETGNSSNRIDFGYDNANNRTSMTYPGGSAGFVFDAINRMTQKTETISGRSYTTDFGYDGNDNLQTITYPSDRIVTYSYNTKNEVTSVTSSNTSGFSVSSVQHYTTSTYLGMLQSYVLSNGITTSLTYNSRNLTTAITAGSAMNIGYGYTDPRGNTTSYTNTLEPSKNQTYGYDDLSRLTSFSGSWGSGSFGYDDTGNRSSKIVGGNTTSYAYTSNRVSSTSGQEVASYSYNTEGLLTGGTWDGISHTLNYDKFDNLTSVLAGAATQASFAYDGDGQRVSKTANGKKTVYHYDLGGRTLSEDDGNGNQIADYIYLEGKLVAKVAAVPVASATPSSVSFGNVFVGTTSVVQAVTVNNTGSADLLIGTLAITGTNSAEYIKSSDTCSEQTLAPSASCTVQISLAPATTGVKPANLSISSNDPVTPSVNIPLNGTGVLPTLTVVKNGAGTGTVVSSPAGISCGQSCSAGYTTGATVILTATPDAGMIFTGWSGEGCTGTGPCSVSLNANKAITASFEAAPAISTSPSTVSIGNVVVNTSSTARDVTISNAGLGNLVIGTISVAGVNAAEFAKGADGCTNNTVAPAASCIVQIAFTPSSTGEKNAYLAVPSNDPTNAIVNIALSGTGMLPTISVTKSGTGTGTVISSPSGIICGATCSAAFSSGASISLTATADAGSVFTGWSGGLCAGAGPCNFTANDNMATSATFTVLPTACFSDSLSSFNSPALATFTDCSTNATSCSWDFGDGMTSTLQNPTHVYKTPGSYTVTHTATNAAGSTSTTQQITVTACSTQPVKNGSTYYATLQAAYDAAASGALIQSLATGLTESLSANRNIDVAIEGGYLCGFPANPPGETTISGMSHIDDGTVRMTNVVVQE